MSEPWRVLQGQLHRWEEEQWGTAWLRRLLRVGVSPDIREDADARFVYPPESSCGGRAYEGEEEWVREELEKGHIEKYTGRVPYPWATVFPVRAREKTRWVTNYKKGLNRWSRVSQFRNTRLEEVAELVEPGDWGAVLDVRSAFKHWRLDPETRYWFAFKAAGGFYVPTVLPFGWKASPWWWSRISRVIEVSFAAAGLRAALYVDDILLLARSQQEAERAVETARRILREMGVVIAEEKAAPPAQVVTYLGYQIDLRTNTWSITPKDRACIKSLATRMWRAKWVARRLVAQLLGKIQGRRMAIQQLNAHTGRLYQWMRAMKGPWGKGHAVPEEVRGELRYWAGLKAHQAASKYIRDEAEWAATSDASKKGWGVCLRNTRMGRSWEWFGYWCDYERRLHITALEATAILRGLEGMREIGIREAVVRWQSDNKAAVATVRNLRSKSRALQAIAQRMAVVIRQVDIRVKPQYLPGVLNGAADYRSRDGLKELVDHRIRRDVYRWVAWARGIQVDMFASRASRMHARYCSAQPDAQSLAVDAFTQEWSKMGRMWLHPPWPLIGTALRKLEAEGGSAAVLVPRWTTAQWWNRWWATMDEVWVLPRMPLLVHAGTRKLMPAPNGRYMLGFTGGPSTWLRSRSAAITGLSKLCGEPVEVWSREGGRWIRS